jgi:ubiquitin-like 1-activating enzyme E1 B
MASTGAMTASSSSSNSSVSSLSGIQATLGASLLNRIATSRVLLVGAGGIGCELLKNLAQSGFRHVEVIDLDTIDVSNLNRQFLFRSHHVGMPKCTVACEAAMAMCPPLPDNGSGSGASEPAKYIAHHGNVKDNERFGVSFFKNFEVVLNALDNVDARRHVNRLCLAANVPLVEAGTTGYLGQVTVICKDANVECYECQPKPAQKVYPICTIRSTPSMPVHTIVWAKELFKLLFHEKPDQSMLYEDPNLGNEGEGVSEGSVSSPDAAQANNGTSTSAQSEGEGKEESEDSTGTGSTSVYMEIVVDQKPKRGSTSLANEDHESLIRRYASNTIEALFVKEIQKQLDMDRYKTAKKKPFVLSSTAIRQGCFDIKAPTKQECYRATNSWTPEECLAELTECIVEAYTYDNTSTTGTASTGPPSGEFDKDDTLAMRFVTAASNLRSHQFGIPMQSLHDAKGIAGNIIPAIATTNAIVAGLQVLQVFRLFQLKLEFEQSQSQPPKNVSDGDGDTSPFVVKKFSDGIKDACRYTYCLRDKTRKGFYLQPTVLPDPNPKCFVCRNAQVDMCLDTTSWTLTDFVEKIIKKRLGFAEPSIFIGDSQIHEEGEGADTEAFAVNLRKTLVQLPSGGIKVRYRKHIYDPIYCLN